LPSALTHGDIEAHDQSVVSVQEPKLMSEEVQVDVVEDEEGATEDGDDKAEDKDTSGS
jgi:large subunit ribosomal protein L25